MGVLRLGLLSVLLMGSPVQWGEAATITVTLPEEDYHRLTTYACAHPIWKFRAAPDACTQGDDAVLRYMMEKILVTGSMGQLYGFDDLHMTVDIQHTGTTD